jgi:FkbM family methyltransferase
LSLALPADGWLLSKFLYRRVLRLREFLGKGRLEAFLRRLLTSRPEHVALGLKMELDPLEWLQIELLTQGVLEPHTTRLYGELLSEGDCYVDVGAHVGFHTLVARRYIGESGRVIAIDPQPYNCQKILANWRVNEFANLLVCVAAVGDRDDVIELSDQAASDKSRLSLQLPAVNDRPQRFRVPLVRLDSLFSQTDCQRVRLLKVDVEGYELEVLKGLGERGPQIEHIIAEVLDAERPAARSQELLTMLRDQGFVLKTVRGAPWQCGEPLMENNLWASHLGAA